MTRLRAEITLWIAAIVLVVAAGTRGRTTALALANSASARPSWESLPAPSAIRNPYSAVVVAASDSFVARNPFRIERKPSGVPYSPAVEGQPPAPPPPPRPALAVSGIIGGPPWEALLEGVPGRQGSTLVRRGDTLGGLRIRSVTRDTVKVTGMDTTWMLTVRRAWQ